MSTTTELDSSVELAVVLYYHISGAVFFTGNLLVSVLILTDRDGRGRGYRKYLFMLQGTSFLVDVLMNLYAPIVLINCRLLYSDSFIAAPMKFLHFLMICVFLYSELAVAYFACVLYRRDVIRPREKRYIRSHWFKVLIIIVTQAMALTFCYSLLVYLREMPKLVYKMPSDIEWAKERTTFLLLHITDNLVWPFCVVVLFGCMLVAAVAILLLQTLLHVKNGMEYASANTRRYQRRAVVSLILQGVVPSLIFGIPLVAESTIAIYSILNGFDDLATNQTAATISVVAYALLSTHTFAHSLTILACTPSYRRTLIACFKALCFPGSARVVDSVIFKEASRTIRNRKWP